MKDELDELAFALFAQAYPVEAHEAEPERFWSYFQRKCPGVDREAMERLLAEAG
jgi:hypothetical protein